MSESVQNPPLEKLPLAKRRRKAGRRFYFTQGAMPDADQIREVGRQVDTLKGFYRCPIHPELVKELEELQKMALATEKTGAPPPKLTLCGKVFTVNPRGNVKGSISGPSNGRCTKPNASGRRTRGTSRLMNRRFWGWMRGSVGGI